MDRKEADRRVGDLGSRSRWYQQHGRSEGGAVRPAGKQAVSG